MTEGKVTGKSRSTTVQGTGLDISKSGSNGARLVPAGSSVFMLGSGGKEMAPASSFFPAEVHQQSLSLQDRV